MTSKQRRRNLSNYACDFTDKLPGNINEKGQLVCLHLSQSSHGIAIVAMNSLQKINSLNIIAKRYIALTSSFTFVNVVTAVKCQSAQVSIWYVVKVFLQQSTSWNLNVTFVNFQVIPKTVSKFISVLLIKVSITRNWRRNVRTSNERNQNLHIW